MFVLLLLLFIAPEGLDGLSGAIAAEGETEEAEDANSGDEVKQNIGGGLVGLRDVVLNDVMATVPGMEGDGKREDKVDGQVEDGGREEQTGRNRSSQGPGRELEDLVFGVLGSTDSLRRRTPSSLSDTLSRA